MNRAVKLTVLGIMVLVMTRYAPIYYHSMEFNRYVQEQVPRIRQQAPLKEAILTKAEEHHIPITVEDITMTTSDSVLRVNVEYQVPVNFYIFTRAFKSTAMGSGFLKRSNS